MSVKNTPPPWRTSVDVTGINNIISKFEMTDKEVRDACQLTLKKIKTPLANEISKIACGRYNIDVKAIKNRLHGTVRTSDETLSIYIAGRRLNLIDFNGTTPSTPQAITRDTTRPKQHTKINGAFITAHPQKPYNIDVEIIKGRRKQLSAKEGYYPFIMKTGAESAGKMPFFVARNPINNGKNREKGVKGVTTLSIPQMFTNEEIEEKVQEKGREIFLKQFEQTMKQIEATNKILGG